MKRPLVWLGSLFALSLLYACDDNAAAGTRIAVIPKGTSHVFWSSIEAGARRAGEELGVEIIWKGPAAEGDRESQIKIVEQFVTEGVSGIVLTPLDDEALLRPVRLAASQKIPVVIADSDLNGELGKDFISFVATDNVEGGRIAGRALVDLLGGSGKVVLLRYNVGSASTENREKGFLEVLGEHPGIEVLVDNQYAGATPEDAIRKSGDMLDTLQRADGIFCSNESATHGMLITLQKNGLAGKVKFVGFDNSPALVQGLRDGEIDALVVQNPRRMGYESVKAVVAHIRGEEVSQTIDTGVQLVTRENMDQAEIAELIKSD
ncbi:MAG: substrate-binding domain-containing protein [Planctomycetota bacterium]